MLCFSDLKCEKSTILEPLEFVHFLGVVQKVLVWVHMTLAYNSHGDYQLKKNFRLNGGFKRTGGSKPPFSDSGIF